MLTFSLTGRVGRIRAGKPCETELAIASSRLVNGPGTNVNWVACVARDQLLRSQIARKLDVGSIVRIEGEIEPRRRQIKDVAFYDVVLVTKSFEVLEGLPPP